MAFLWLTNSLHKQLLIKIVNQDQQWLQMNQVTHIINCAGKHCKNSPKLNGINFLTYEWSENNIQNIIEQNVIGAAISFIEEAKKQCGSVLVHCHQSESRPFCILASYLMIRYQWNLFKTLEFLNSRKQDIELQPAFFQQLTSLHQKLQEKGLIKSRTWNREENMSDQQILLTNTFLNSKKRTQQMLNQHNSKQEKKSRKQVRSKRVNLRDDLSEVHVYFTQTILAELNPKIINYSENLKQNTNNLRQKQQSIAVKYFEQDGQKDNLKGESNSMKQNKSSNEINVTKRWAELRQTWTKQKQNNQLLQNQNQGKVVCNFLLQSENARKVEKNQNVGAISAQREQKVTDRIQDKLNMIRNGYQVKPAAQIMKRRDHTPITGKKIKSVADNIKNNGSRQPDKTERISFIQRKEPQIMSNQSVTSEINNKQTQNYAPFYQPNRNSSNNNKQSNANQMKTTLTKMTSNVNESRSTNGENGNPTGNFIGPNSSSIISQVKQLGNKSVLIVKPNQYGGITNHERSMGNDSTLSQSRNSKRKVFDSNENKQNRYSLNKDNSLLKETSKDNPQLRSSKVSNFFRVDNQLLNGKNASQSEMRAKRHDLSNNVNRVSESNLNGSKISSSLSNKISSSLNGMSKVRSSSTRVSRKQEIQLSNTSISKNLSYNGKGKWKM